MISRTKVPVETAPVRRVVLACKFARDETRRRSYCVLYLLAERSRVLLAERSRVDSVPSFSQSPLLSCSRTCADDAFSYVSRTAGSSRVCTLLLVSPPTTDLKGVTRAYNPPPPPYPLFLPASLQQLPSLSQFRPARRRGCLASFPAEASAPIYIVDIVWTTTYNLRTYVHDVQEACLWNTYVCT